MYGTSFLRHYHAYLYWGSIALFALVAFCGIGIKTAHAASSTWSNAWPCDPVSVVNCNGSLFGPRLGYPMTQLGVSVEFATSTPMTIYQISLPLWLDTPSSTQAMSGTLLNYNIWKMPKAVTVYDPSQGTAIYHGQTLIDSNWYLSTIGPAALQPVTITFAGGNYFDFANYNYFINFASPFSTTDPNAYLYLGYDPSATDGITDVNSYYTTDGINYSWIDNGVKAAFYIEFDYGNQAPACSQFDTNGLIGQIEWSLCDTFQRLYIAPATILEDYMSNQLATIQYHYPYGYITRFQQAWHDNVTNYYTTSTPLALNFTIPASQFGSTSTATFTTSDWTDRYPAIANALYQLSTYVFLIMFIIETWAVCMLYAMGMPTKL